MEEKTNIISKEELERLKKRILAKCVTDKKSECQLWKGSLDQAAFGRIHTSIGVRSVHRIMFMCENTPDGVIEDGMLVYHTCGNRTCVNPSHLYLAPLPQPGPRMSDEKFARLPKGVQRIYELKQKQREKKIEEKRANGVIEYQKQRKGEA